MKTTLLNIIRGHWALNPEWAQAHTPLIDRLLKGESIGNELGERDISTEARLDERFMASPVYNVGFYTDLGQLPKGSTVIVDVVGPITKYGGLCSYGSMEYAALTERLSASDNVSTIIFNIDSPGGQCAGTSTFGDAIRASGKRTIGFIQDGYAASAGYWIACCCDEIYCSHATDQVGSIGVYCTLADYTGYYEKMGLKVFEIYAPQSTDKNGDSKAVFAGKPEALQEDLRIVAAAFIATVKENRGDRLTSEEWSTGKMYYAPDAITIGLIDGIKSFPQIMEMIESGETPLNNSANPKTNKQMFGNKLPKTYGLKGKAATDISAEDLQGANAELHANGIDADLTLQSASAGKKVTEELASANEALEASATRITELEATAKTAKETQDASAIRVTELEGQLATEKKKAGASYNKPKAAKDDDDTSEDEAAVDISGFAHNQKMDSLLDWK